MSRSRLGGEGSSGGSQQQVAPSDPQPSATRVRDFAPPLVVALLIVTTSPVMRQLRDFLLESLGTRFAGVLAVGLGATIVAAIVGAALQIHEPRPARRWLRFGGLGLALALLGIQIFGFGTGNPLIDAVEHFHLVEYGLLGALFYRAFRRYRDGSVLPLTVLAVTLVGIVDELVQWWTPVRVGDARDVLLNAYAGLCGMLFGLALAPPEGWVLRGGWVAARRVGWAAALTCLAFAFFYDRAHLGYEVTDPEAGHFRDWHSREQLLELEAERAVQWAADPPTGLEIAGPEDFYLTAATRHVAYRDESLARGDWFDAWKEDLIVETYYAPFLELRSFDGIPVQNRLAPEQRQELDAKRPRPDPVAYESPVLAEEIAVVPRPAFWAVAVAVAMALVAVPEGMRRRRPGKVPEGDTSSGRRRGAG
jgi:hypothetical protein